MVAYCFAGLSCILAFIKCFGIYIISNIDSQNIALSSCIIVEYVGLHFDGLVQDCGISIGIVALP